MRVRAVLPLFAAGIGLAGALAATIALYRAAQSAVDGVLEQRLRGAGEAATPLLGELGPTPGRLAALMLANELDSAYVLGPQLRMIADAHGRGGRVDLLRLDIGRIKRAFAGEATVGRGYALGALEIMTGYFPIRGQSGQGGGSIPSVLALEAGQSFVAARAGIVRARNLGVALAVLCALGLALLAARWARAERAGSEAGARAARGEALSRMAAMAAHEIRNPLGVIRGTIDLMRERSGAILGERDREALNDIVHEVERLRRLTQDLTDLAADRPLDVQPIVLGDVIGEAARAAEAAFPNIKIRCDINVSAPVTVDAARLRQVLANLLVNAAHAQGHGEIRVRATQDAAVVRILIQDEGPGIPEGASERLFDLYFTTKSEGTGLGLAIARRLVEQHGGKLLHRPDLRPGTTFEIVLPAHPRQPR
jgi:two-component system OmpR family sensor kinase